MGSNGRRWLPVEQALSTIGESNGICGGFVPGLYFETLHIWQTETSGPVATQVTIMDLEELDYSTIAPYLLNIIDRADVFLWAGSLLNKALDTVNAGSNLTVSFENAVIMIIFLFSAAKTRARKLAGNSLYCKLENLMCGAAPTRTLPSLVCGTLPSLPPLMSHACGCAAGASGTR